MAYRKNDSDKMIDDNYAFFAHSTVPVNTDGEVKNVGKPTGAGDNRIVSKAGTFLCQWDDRPDTFGDKAGKKRSADNNPIGAGNES